MKTVHIFGVTALALGLAACGSQTAPVTPAATTKAAATTAAASQAAEAIGKYTIYNNAGENISELYLYPTGASDKGANLASGKHGFGVGHAMFVTYTDGSADTKLTLEYTTDSGVTGKFETLSVETAPISIISEDARTGATPLTFEATPAVYDIYNVTGEKITDLYIYPTGSSDKGENLIKEAGEKDGHQTVQFDAVPENLIKDDKVGQFTIEFTTESGYTGSFDNLSYETAPISLLAEDAKTGATGIAFSAPEK